jgi:hypothetical protein
MLTLDDYKPDKDPDDDNKKKKFNVLSLLSKKEKATIAVTGVVTIGMIFGSVFAMLPKLIQDNFVALTEAEQTSVIAEATEGIENPGTVTDSQRASIASKVAEIMERVKGEYSASYSASQSKINETTEPPVAPQPLVALARDATFRWKGTDIPGAIHYNERYVFLPTDKKLVAFVYGVTGWEAIDPTETARARKEYEHIEAAGVSTFHMPRHLNAAFSGNVHGGCMSPGGCVICTNERGW